MRMRCVVCGQDTGEAAQACVLCGAPVAGQSSAAPASAAGRPGSTIGQQIPQDALAPQQAKSARRRALIGIGGGLAVLVAVIAAVVMTRWPSGVQRSSSGVRKSSSAVPVMYQSLQAGNCLTGSDVSLSLTTGSQWPEYVTAVPCTQPHIAEVFFADNIWPQSRKAYPGETATDNRAAARCARAFQAYDGIASKASEFDTIFIAPDASTWRPGDRFVVCVAYMQNPGTPTGTSPVKYSIKGSRR